MSSIDHEAGRELVSWLSSEYVISLADGKVWLYYTSLPGDTVSAALETPDGVVHLFLDLSKPDTHLHAREMVREWLGVDACEWHRSIVQMGQLAPL